MEKIRDRFRNFGKKQPFVFQAGFFAFLDFHGFLIEPIAVIADRRLSRTWSIRWPGKRAVRFPRSLKRYLRGSPGSEKDG